MHYQLILVQYYFLCIASCFASSFFRAFEIMLPNSWANKVDSQADRGGIVGILFMALVFLFLYRTYRRYAFSKAA
jgi:O-antigen/teichoic acid export membrane protein